MKRRDLSRLYHEGVRLFNDGQWFEAHEVWEELWHALGGERRQFVQVLIQCAVSLEHVRRGNPRGALTMLDRARARFDGLPAMEMGIDAAALVAAIDALIAPLREMPATALPPRAGRAGQVLPVNLGDAPRIALRDDPFASGANGVNGD